MYAYKIRRCALCSPRAMIEFMGSNADFSLRSILRELFEPLGYVVRTEEPFFLIYPGKNMPHAGKISISSDLYGGLWAEADTWGDLPSHHWWLGRLDTLLAQSGHFIRVPGYSLFEEEDQDAA